MNYYCIVSDRWLYSQISIANAWINKIYEYDVHNTIGYALLHGETDRQKISYIGSNLNNSKVISDLVISVY